MYGTIHLNVGFHFQNDGNTKTNLISTKNLIQHKMRIDFFISYVSKVKDDYYHMVPFGTSCDDHMILIVDSKVFNGCNMMIYFHGF